MTAFYRCERCGMFYRHQAEWQNNRIDVTCGKGDSCKYDLCDECYVELLHWLSDGKMRRHGCEGCGNLGKKTCDNCSRMYARWHNDQYTPK